MSKYKDKIIALRADGRDYDEIAEMLGCAKSTVAYWLGNNQADKTAERQKRYRQSIRDVLVDYKESHPCTDCKKLYPYYVMDFDHMPDFEKSFNIGGTHQSIQRVLNEMSKCEVVCANCHRVRTHIRKYGNI